MKKISQLSFRDGCVHIYTVEVNGKTFHAIEELVGGYEASIEIIDQQGDYVCQCLLDTSSNVMDFSADEGHTSEYIGVDGCDEETVMLAMLKQVEAI